MAKSLIHPVRTLLALAIGLVAFSAPAKADQVLFTFAEMLKLKALPAEAERRALSEEETILYRNFEFYAYTAFETLQIANEASILLHDEPLFCAPDATFRFREEGDIARLADRVTAELFALTEKIGASPDRYDDRPASAVLLLGLRAAFPCPDDRSQLAQR